MSATNRGAERQENDNYPTPLWCVRRLLEACPLPDGEWAEPCVGDGAIARAVKSMRGDAVTIGGIDIRDTRESAMRAGCSWVVVMDYLERPAPAAMEGCGVIITNPPFSLALPVIRKALTEAPWVAMLLRVNFLGSDERSSWLRSEMPDIYTLPDRPSFVASHKCKSKSCDWKKVTAVADTPIRVCPQCTGAVQRSTSDSAEYGWFVWTPERGRQSGKVRILASTPEAERKAT
jgi:hypothetical protein